MGTAGTPTGAEWGARGPVRPPAAVPAGPVGRAVLDALCGAVEPVTVRDVAVRAGARRDSVGRVLGRLERAGWAARVRGDVRAGVPDAWFATVEARAAWKATLDDSSSLDLRSKRTARMAAAPSAPPPIEAPYICQRGSQGSGARQPEESGPVRLAGGQLQEQVRGLLEEKAPASLGPVELARLLGGRSQGAVANACRRLVDLGLAVCTCEAPLRYAAGSSASACDIA